MAVTVNATATAVVNQASGATSITSTNLTIAAGATALLVWFYCSGGAPTSPAVSWDATGTPQSMTLITSVTNGSAYASLYGLLSPRTGNLTLKATWTQTTLSAAIDAIAFAGTATDTIAHCFPNAVTNSGTSTTPAVTATSAVGNINVAGVSAVQSVSAFSATGSTLVFNDNSHVGSAGARATGAASVAWSGTLTLSGAWAALATDVAVPVVAGTPWFPISIEPDLIFAKPEIVSY